jgi:hypothetical protein
LTITIQSKLIVWPGDTNNDKIADQADILPLGLHWNKTGPARENASMAWSGQLAMIWTPLAATYADANGDGTVNQADVLPIGLNWSKMQTQTLAVTEPSLVPLSKGQTSDAKLMIVINGSTQPDQNFYIDIMANEVSNLFGLSFELIYTPASIIDPQVAEAGPNNLLGTDVIYFSVINKTVGLDSGKVSVGITRKSGQGGVSGSGLVTRITAHMSATAVNGLSTTQFTLINIQANDPSGNPIKIDSTIFKLVTDINAFSSVMPADFALYNNYPNPFNPSTTIPFLLPVKSDVRLTLLNIMGEVITEIASGEYEAGQHQVILDASELATGVYFYKLEAAGFRAVKKLVLMK